MGRVGSRGGTLINKPRIAVVDLDGTITESGVYNGMNVFSPVRQEAIDTLQDMKAAGWTIKIFTARHWTEETAIKNLLDASDVPYDAIICGKPMGHLYIDDRSVCRNGNWFSVWTALDNMDGDTKPGDRENAEDEPIPPDEGEALGFC